jgi:hypothetical protein
MKKFWQKTGSILTMLMASLLLSGCLEVRTEITVNEDGSGTLDSTVVISERMMKAMEASEATADSGGGMSMNAQMGMAFNEEKFREVFGENGSLEDFAMEDLEDGSRKITYKAKVNNIAKFLQEDHDLSDLDLRMVKLDEETGAILWGGGIEQEGGMNLELEQMYALAKGMLVQVTVNMPVALQSETGQLSEDGKSVTWTTDLRDAEGLEATKEFMAAKGEENARATFPLSGINFDLPEATATALGEKAEGTTRVEGDVEGLQARLAALTVTRAKQLEGDSVTDKARFFNVAEENLKLEVILLWEEGQRPVSQESPVLEEITTDTGESLLPDDDPHSFSSEIDEESEAVVDDVQANAPPKDATRLAVVRGYMPVVSGVETSTVTVEDPLQKVGEGKIESDALKKVGGFIKTIDGTQVHVQTQGEAIDEVVLVKGEERLTTGRSWSSMNNVYTYRYNFSEPVEAGDTLEIVVRESETRVKVPFEARDVELP